MVQLKVSRRTQLGLAILAVGVLAVVIVITAKLGWTGFFPALALLAVGAWFATRGHDNSGPRTMFAYCVALIVIFVGFGWLHPQRWAQPGWKLATPGATLIARHGGGLLFFDDGSFAMRQITTGQIVWQFRTDARHVIVNSSGVLAQTTTDPKQADLYSLGTGRATTTKPWQPKADARILTISADGRHISGVRSGKPTPQQMALMPSVDSGEKVIASAAWTYIAARLVDASDPTGHRYTRLDIVDGKTVETFRVSGATGLQLLDEVLVVDSKVPHVVPLIRRTPKKA